MTDKRLNDLELKFMDQEQTVNDLSEMVSRQWDEIEKLKRRLIKASDRIVTLEDALPSGESDQKPPHY